MNATGITIPPGTYQDAQFNGNTLLISKSTLADSGYAYINQSVDLANNDFSITYNIATMTNPGGVGNNYGSAFVFSNDPTFVPKIDSDYARLGIYNRYDGTSPAIKNAIAVEFDASRTTEITDFGVPASVGSHVAITRPTGPTATDHSVRHYALSALPNPYANGKTNTARITWKLTDPGASDALSDNVYTLTYHYYQGAATATGTPTVTGSQSYTYAEAQALFGGTMTVRAGFSGSSASLVGQQQTLSFPPAYSYTVNYYIQRPDGTKTTVRVPGLAQKTGTLAAGPGSVGPLPSPPTGYQLVPNQSTDVTISTLASNNVFNYYYVDAPPRILGATDTTVERTQPFDPRAGVTADDGLDSDLTSAIQIDGTVDVNTVGTYQLTYRVTDTGGNTVSVVRTVTVVDTTAPPAPGIDPIAEASTQVSGTAEPGSTVRLTLPDSSVRTATADATTGRWTITGLSPLMADQVVRATATDAANNQGTAATRTVDTEYVATTITKKWVDPLTTTFAPVTIGVLQDGTQVTQVSVDPGATVTVPNLRRYRPVGATEYPVRPSEYTYTVSETPPAGYRVAYSGDRASGFTVTNTRILGQVQLTTSVSAAPAQAQLVLTNSVSDGGPAISGAKYTITKTFTVDPATGQQTPVSGATPITANVGDTVNLDQYAVYNVVQTTRAPGHYLNPEPFTVEFPLMDNGAIASNQTLTVNPKIIPVTGDASLLKTANNTTTPVVGATFNLFRTKDAQGNAVSPAQQVGETLTTGSDGTIQATGLTEGEYYFIEVGTVDPYAADTVTKYPFTVTVSADGTQTAPIAQLKAQNYTKPSASEVTKLVNGAATTQASIGDTVTYTINVNVPVDIAQYTKYDVSDTFDSRLSNIQITGTPAGFTGSTSGNVVTFTGDPATLAAGTTQTITMTAVLNSTVATGDSIDNVAKVTFDNGRGTTGSFDTAPATISLVEGSITVNKTDGDTGAALAGATFVLVDGSGNPVLDPATGQPFTATSGSDGKATFSRVPYGTHYVRETAAPADYRLPIINIGTQVKVDSATQNPTLDVKNYKSLHVLPATGTWGALPFYGAGAALIGVFALLLWRQRRNKESVES